MATHGRVAIVGGGLAGLACARELCRLGIESTILEATDRPGGRVKTDNIDGFVLDRGFQVLFSAYPNARTEIGNLSDSAVFGNGAYIWTGKPNAFVHFNADNWIHAGLSPVMTLGDKIRFLRLKSRLLQRSVRQEDPRTDLSAEDYLTNLGFSRKAMDQFLRPFLGGVFADDSLSVSHRQLEFVLRMLFSGKTVWPKGGIEDIVRRQLGDEFAPAVRIGASVTKVLAQKGRVTGIQLDSGEIIEAEAVVLASGPAELDGAAGPESYRHSVTLYIETEKEVVRRPFLILNGSRADGKMQGVVNHVAPLSRVNRLACPEGRYYLSATILGNIELDDGALSDKVEKELQAWFGPNWAKGMIRIDRIRYAQLKQEPGCVRKGTSTETSGLFRASEHVTNSSIDGAIEAGHRAARAVKDYL